MPNQSSGIIVVDKPANMTSARLVARLKTLTAAKKAGHTGTLDPFATGVMVCCINRATRLAGFFLHGTKKYEAVLHLGIETDTQDATGTIISRSDIRFDQEEKIFSKENLQNVFKRFEGSSEQLPPVYSALKHKGVPLYKFARKGRPIQKPARRIDIFLIDIIDIHLPEIRFEVSCSAGTYIRTLCSDIGKALGCGAHLKALRRIESCGFTINEAFTLAELETLSSEGILSDAVISMAHALHHMPAWIADQHLTEKIKDGKPIFLDDFKGIPSSPADGLMKIIDNADRLLAVIRFDAKMKKFTYCCVFNN